MELNQPITDSHFTGTASRCKYPPGLYLVATPIGNLEDITLRALSTLKIVDKILCEDTRITKKLLQFYGIKKQLISFHNHSDDEKLHHIIDDLKTGTSYALVSDAGTPLISDPGFDLVRACADQGIYTTVIPGPCALIAGLALSTLPSHEFFFGGFLPAKTMACQKVLEHHLSFKATIIYYESAQRLIKTLTVLKDIAPLAHVAVARELTKIYESLVLNTPAALIDHYQQHPPKGEIVLMIHVPQSDQQSDDNWQAALIQTMQDMPLAESVKLIAQTYDIAKNTVYDYALACKKDSSSAS